uniref:gliding motility-associated ABC transporter permease subunit GldF n=1 Tax=Flavobacterium sp. TaxID=239 RepID=UPI00404B7ABB
MKAILLREIKSFFGSPIGYMVILVFLLLNGLFLWVFEGEFNILNSGYADLSPFFSLAPWVLLFLIPAVTMRSFSDEKKQGTIELLLTKPISTWQIAQGKFLGAFILIIIAVLPTLLYVNTISDLTLLQDKVDYGSIMGSYFGLLFLIAAYTAIGIFCSTLSENQIVSFIASVFLCFLFFYGLEGISSLLGDFDFILVNLSMQEHFKSMRRGVIDTRDLVYFLSVYLFFIAATVYKLTKLKQI